MPDYQYTLAEINSAFIEPIRSAMLIDDRFPRYLELFEASDIRQDDAPKGAAVPEKHDGSSNETKGPEFTSAKVGPDRESLRDLLQQCEKRGLTCAVENRHQVASSISSRLHTSDLLVLDYHLVPGDDTIIGPAIAVLRQLAESPHANLVVVYTAAKELERVKLEIASNLRGIRRNREEDDDYQIFVATQTSDFDAPTIESFIEGGYEKISREVKKEFAASLRAAEIPGNRCKQYLTCSIEDQLAAKLGVAPVDGDPFESALQFSAPGSQNIWIAYKNVFVAVTPKGSGVQIFDRLAAALVSWNPSPLQLLLIHARNQLEARGFLSDWKILKDDVRQRALLYHLLGGEDPSVEARLEELFTRVFDTAMKEVTAEVVKIARSLLQQPLADGASEDGNAELTSSLEGRRLEVAGRAVRSSASVSKRDVLHELNSFLSTRHFTGTYVQTGSIFRSVSTQSPEYWVCMTPDCNLVPRKPNDKLSWEADLFPLSPITALRLFPERGANIDIALQNATRGTHIFMEVGGERLILGVLHEHTHQPRPELFIGSGVLKEDAGKLLFSAARISKDDNDQEPRPVLKMSEFEVVCQLRSSYADRLITQTGQHSSRIGVDYVNAYSVDQRLDVAESAQEMAGITEQTSEQTNENADLAAVQMAGEGLGLPQNEGQAVTQDATDVPEEKAPAAQERGDNGIDSD